MAFSQAQKARARRSATKLLREIGVTSTLKAHKILVESIAVVAEYPYKGENVNKLFQEVAETLKEKSSYNYIRWFQNCNVCLDKAYKRCRQSKLEELYGSTTDPDKSRVTLQDFIVTSAQLVNERMSNARRKEWD